ncbi:FadR/GntR family transcriptional regulator [Paeniglutamicibacter psychrophenolicus]|uniref:FadR/GntR family transcriptional regulator n=1 Tax=Paeniglutamicibacter psychrophenolicus TaxID=257454 RepID=UPI00278A2963|nr:FCD domain-containing protein [Paeniglutamicibacter psychrophenolicus]MDQ0093049.1 DNA-binding FadR family transcriptional regulator [Paeniglutamicibacter psychrophenolicus]
MILEEAAKFRTEADLKDVRRLLKLLEDACGDEVSFLNIGIEFHRRIGRISKNQILTSTYCGLLDFIESRVARLTWPENTEMSIYHHKRVRLHANILNILEAQDVSKIPAIVKEHHSQVQRR